MIKTEHSMKKIIFVCHGNICRSPMAEFVMKKLVKDAGREAEFEITSMAVSGEEWGNPIYPPAKAKMREHGIPFGDHRAHKITPQEFAEADLVVIMDESNRRLLTRIVGDISGATAPSGSFVSPGLPAPGTTAPSRITSPTGAFANQGPVASGRSKVRKLMEFVGLDRDVADPWYTGDFEATYRDIFTACRALLAIL